MSSNFTTNITQATLGFIACATSTQTSAELADDFKTQLQALPNGELKDSFLFSSNAMFLSRFNMTLNITRCLDDNYRLAMFCPENLPPPTSAPNSTYFHGSSSATEIDATIAVVVVALALFLAAMTTYAILGLCYGLFKKVHRAYTQRNLNRMTKMNSSPKVADPEPDQSFAVEMVDA